MLKINFICLADENMASTRFRVLKPYELLKNKGYEVSIKRFPDLDADINVFSKHIEPQRMLSFMENCSTKKIFDVCDDHFDSESLGPYYTKMCEMADVVTCTNQRMERRLKHLFPSKNVQVFFDPINTTRGSPKWSENPKVIWFGHSTNLMDALPWLDFLPEDIELTICSNADVKGNGFTFVPFATGWVEDNLKNYDIVLLPQKTDSETVVMKSENRAVDALTAGCMIVYNNEALYKNWELIGGYKVSTPKDLDKFFNYYRNKKNKQEILDMITEGQKTAWCIYNDEHIALQLEKILDGLKT